jgi:hypothetical protein
VRAGDEFLRRFLVVLRAWLVGRIIAFSFVEIGVRLITLIRAVDQGTEARLHVPIDQATPIVVRKVCNAKGSRAPQEHRENVGLMVVEDREETALRKVKPGVLLEHLQNLRGSRDVAIDWLQHNSIRSSPKLNQQLGRWSVELARDRFDIRPRSGVACGHCLMCQEFIDDVAHSVCPGAN